MRSFAITTAILVLWASPLAATPVTMYLEGGRTLSVDLDRVGQDGATWRLNPSDPNTQVTPLSQISHIDFPPPAIWEEAEEILATGDLDAAFKKFAEIAKDQFSYGYPVPGNYASKALIELLAIQRRKLDAVAIADQARILKREAATLTPEERKIDPVIESWIALSKEEYETALTSLETIENGNSEVAYLRGRALEGSGEIEGAIESYAETYTLGIGDRSEMSRDALRRSITILDALEKKARFLEVHAQLKLYAELYGAGKLWPDAPEHLVTTAAAELNTIEGMIDKPIAVVEEVPLHERLGIPPPEDRDWILTEETDPKIYFVGQLALTPKGNAEETDDGWSFDGDSKLIGANEISFRDNEFYARVHFTPETEDGILFRGIKESGGFELYLKAGELIFSWSPQLNGKGRTEFTLGKVNLGARNSLGIQLRSSKKANAWFNSEKALDNKAIPGLIAFKEKLPVTIAGPAADTPGFTGVIHHLCLGTDATIAAVHEKERLMFGNKKVVGSPPPPPAPKVAAAPSAPSAPSAPAATPSPAPAPPKPYEPPLALYELRGPEFMGKERDWILPQELEQRIYMLEKPPFTNNGAAETDTGLAFDGETSHLTFEPVLIRRAPLRIRGLFTPQTEKFHLIHGGTKRGGNFGLYAIDGDLKLFWKNDRRQEAKTYSLGKLLLGKPNTFHVHFANEDNFKGNLNGVPLEPGGPLPKFITERQPIDIRVAGKSGPLVKNLDLPRFKGTIHCLSIGAGTGIKFWEVEQKMLNGKRLVYAPPPPPNSRLCFPNSGKFRLRFPFSEEQEDAP